LTSAEKPYPKYIIPPPVDDCYENPGTYTVPQLVKKHDTDQKEQNAAAVASWSK
jgi:hypothetical protein